VTWFFDSLTAFQQIGVMVGVALIALGMIAWSVLTTTRPDREKTFIRFASIFVAAFAIGFSVTMIVAVIIGKTP
jgi:hypothetical protein